jgi:hypothetical protein
MSLLEDWERRYGLQKDVARALLTNMGEGADALEKRVAQAMADDVYGMKWADLRTLTQVLMDLDTSLPEFLNNVERGVCPICG